jgi:DNA-directed RNA polymerase sigma subunit (sigma70/sigma32)
MYGPPQSCKRKLKMTVWSAPMQLVVSLAERYKGRQIYFLDLIERGNEGLLRAVQSLTDRVPESFSAHATPFIERALAEAAVSIPTRPAHKA